MMRNGASIIDSGGESSRPGAEKISVNEEQKRILEPIRYLKQNRFKSLISLTFAFEYVSSDLILRVCNISEILNGP